MAYTLDVKDRALALRRSGSSIREIARTLGISPGTASVWLSSVRLSKHAQQVLKSKQIIGQYKSMLVKQVKKESRQLDLEMRVQKQLETFKLNEVNAKLLCSILYWTEGGRQAGSLVTFMNSDPEMVVTFLKLMRFSFELDERKFRSTLHIHTYHKDDEIKKFWSDTTGIPIAQFTKSYQKQNTQRRKREGYMGCIRVRYYDVRVARELKAYYNVFSRVMI